MRNHPPPIDWKPVLDNAWAACKTQTPTIEHWRKSADTQIELALKLHRVQFIDAAFAPLMQGYCKVAKAGLQLVRPWQPEDYENCEDLDTSHLEVGDLDPNMIPIPLDVYEYPLSYYDDKLLDQLTKRANLRTWKVSDESLALERHLIRERYPHRHTDWLVNAMEAAYYEEPTPPTPVEIDDYYQTQMTMPLKKEGQPCLFELAV